MDLMSGRVMRIDDLQDWFVALMQPRTLVELAVVLLCMVVAWGFCWALRRALAWDGQSILLGRRLIDGVLFPMLVLCFNYAAFVVFSRNYTVVLLKLAIPVFTSLVVIRLGVKYGCQSACL